MTEAHLREAAKVDPKTLGALLNGTRWPQEKTRLKIETALDWEVGSLQDLKEGRSAVARASQVDSPLQTASNDELLEEIKRRLETASIGGALPSRGKVQDPPSWSSDWPAGQDSAVRRNQHGR